MADTAKGQVGIVELSRAQQGAVRRGAEARATVPAFRVADDAPAAELPALLAAVAGALRDQPEVNGAYRDGRLERYGRVNVAVALGTAAPVLYDADTKDAAAIGGEL